MKPEMQKLKPTEKAAAKAEDQEDALRTCIVTRAKAEDGLLRFVFSPDGAVVPDLKHKLPGRGAYVSCRKGLVAEAVKKGLFSRAFKRKVEPAPDLADLVEGLLRRDVLSALGIANKAGAVVAGFDTLQAEVKKSRFIAFMHGRDASEGGLEKMERMAQAQSAPLYRLFDIAELSEALGRENTVNLGVRRAEGAKPLEAKAMRLAAYLAP